MAKRYYVLAALGSTLFLFAVAQTVVIAAH